VATRIKTQDVGDGQVATADLADSSVTYPKLFPGTDSAIENDGTGAARVKCDGTTIQRTASGLAVLPTGLPELGGFRNRFLNGALNLWQRGTSFSAATLGANFYAADRFACHNAGATAVVSRQTWALGFGPADIETGYYLRWANASTPAATPTLSQKLEDVRSLAGKQVTLSFWGRIASGTHSLNVDVVQNFGTGGSPTADATTSNVATAVTLTTTFTRHTLTFTVPSVTGSTIGSTTPGYCWLKLKLPTSASWTCEFAELQVEVGAVRTPFERRPFAAELAMCQRYYEKSLNVDAAPGSGALGPVIAIVTNGPLAASTAGNLIVPFPFAFKAEKRAAPTLTLYDLDGTAGAARIYPLDAKKTGATVAPTAVGGMAFISFSNVSATAVANGSTICAHWVADAEL
jgi:hypothetical protein